MAADTYTSIKDIEAEAEKIIEAAKAEAKSTTDAARAEAREILSSEVSLGDVADQEKDILAKAREEAQKKIEEAELRAGKLKKLSTDKVETVVKEIMAHTKGNR